MVLSSLPHSLSNGPTARGKGGQLSYRLRLSCEEGKETKEKHKTKTQCEAEQRDGTAVSQLSFGGPFRSAALRFSFVLFLSSFRLFFLIYLFIYFSTEDQKMKVVK